MSDTKREIQTSTTPNEIRIGFIGAGAIAVQRHLPELKKLAHVKLVAVANRSLKSSQAIADAWGFAEAMEDWRALVVREDIDAVFIGTWPYMHKEISIAALEAGKHVFCQARMAMDLSEARAMLSAAQSSPHLVNMICPPPTRMPFEPFIKDLLAQGSLGPIQNIELLCITGSSLDKNSVHWREDIAFSGRQIMMVGILAETLNAWVGPYESLLALTSIPIKRKKNAQGQEVEIQIPQIVHVLGRLAGGIPISEFHTGVETDPSSHLQQLTIRGQDGALRYKFGKVIEMARPGQGFKKVSVPAKLQRPWQVEADFIKAIENARAGKKWKVSPDFAEGLIYMRKMQAVYESARTGQVVRPAEL